ncbi:MAG: energy-coupling factor ABC transporter ATP-binding protein [Candidatus Ranarchaeia archaeon]
MKDINLAVNPKDFLLVVGPTGCGKTTLCRSFNGLIPHFYAGKMKGEVRVKDQNTHDVEVSELAKTTGLVFQNPENQLISLNVERELSFAPENLGLPPEEIERRVEDVISTLGLESIRKKPPFDLSGGEQQRVAIGSVLTLKPKILVLDEPTANLDPVAAKQLLETVGHLNKSADITVIITEHKIDLVAPLANRMILMEKGEIKIDSSPRSVLASSLLEDTGVNPPRVVELYKRITPKHKRQEIPLTVEEAVQTFFEGNK